METVSQMYDAPMTTEDAGGTRDLESALSLLPSGARHVFVLHAVYGYSHDETGKMLDIAPGTSKAQLHRAKKLLRQQLEPAETDA